MREMTEVERCEFERLMLPGGRCTNHEALHPWGRKSWEALQDASLPACEKARHARILRSWLSVTSEANAVAYFDESYREYWNAASDEERREFIAHVYNTAYANDNGVAWLKHLAAQKAVEIFAPVRHHSYDGQCKGATNAFPEHLGRYSCGRKWYDSFKKSSAEKNSVIEVDGARWYVLFNQYRQGNIMSTSDTFFVAVALDGYPEIATVESAA